MNGVNYQDLGGNLIDTSGQHTYDQSNQTAIQNSGRLCSSDEITSFLTNKNLPQLSNYNSMAACTNSSGLPDWYSLQNMEVWSVPNQTSLNLWTF